MTDKSKGAKKFLEIDVFLNNAFFLIKTATELVSKAKHEKTLLKQLLEKLMERAIMSLVDKEGFVMEEFWVGLGEMLHSIFFIGIIRLPPFSPKDIFEKDMCDKTDKLFRKPFKVYQTYVAGRTPFSYFLELVWRCNGRNNDSDVRKQLSATRRECKSYHDRSVLIPTVIAVIHVGDEDNKRKYYGASVGCLDGCRELLTLLSCWHDWHPYVQSAVMSVFPDRKDKARQIILSSDVSCKAYDLKKFYEEIDPCKRCNQLYSLPNHTTTLNKPGNCAETEAISNLLKSEENVVLNTGKINDQMVQSEDRINMKDYFNKTLKKMKGQRKCQCTNECKCKHIDVSKYEIEVLYTVEGKCSA